MVGLSRQLLVEPSDLPHAKLLTSKSLPDFMPGRTQASFPEGFFDRDFGFLFLAILVNPFNGQL